MWYLVRWKNDCVAVDRFMITKQEVNGVASSAAGGESFAKFTYRDLVESVADAPWYAGGGFDVTLGNWQGSIIYTDAATAPTYTLTNGSETLTGAIAATATAALAEVPVAGSRVARALRVVRTRAMLQ